MNVIQEAKIEGKIEIAREMIKDHIGIEQIVKFTKLPEAKIKELQKQL